MDRDLFIGALRSSLTQLDDLPALRQSPLLQILGKEEMTPSALQRLLIESINRLRNGGDWGNTSHHDVLYFRYVERMAQPDVAFQLGLSVRQLRRYQTSALEALADYLSQQYDLSLQTGGTASASAPEASATGMEKEVAWLRRGNSAEISSVEVEWFRAREEVAILRRHYGVTIDEELSAELPAVSLPPVLLRQTLLTILSYAIPQVDKLTVRGAVVEPSGGLTLTLSGELRQGHHSQGIYSSVQMAAQLLAPFESSAQVRSIDPLCIELTFITARGTPILLIDDNLDIRYLFRRYASDSGFHIIDSDDGANIVELAQQFQVAAIIVDIMMPALDGWELIAKLRHHPATESIPIVVCTILPQQDLSYHLGVASFMQKPVSRATFLATLNNLFPSHEYR